MNELDASLTEKLKNIESWFSSRIGSIVAFSGGIDSSLVLFLARKYQGPSAVVGVISNSESLKNKDFLVAQSFCENYDITLHVIKTNELSDIRYSQNPVNRCFFCKDHLYNDLQALKIEYPGFDILNGTNVDDLGDYRPGLEAAKQKMVLSPLADCNFSKTDIRSLALFFKLPNWNKPASPCLSSRIPYHQEVTYEKLRQIEAAEDMLNRLGFEDVRVRHYGITAKIEVQSADIENLLSAEESIRDEMKFIGFDNIEIDREGLISGKLNRVLFSQEVKKDKL